MTLATFFPLTVLPATNLLGEDGVEAGLLEGSVWPPTEAPAGSLPTGGIQCASRAWKTSLMITPRVRVLSLNLEVHSARSSWSLA